MGVIFCFETASSANDVQSVFEKSASNVETVTSKPEKSLWASARLCSRYIQNYLLNSVFKWHFDRVFHTAYNLDSSGLGGRCSDESSWFFLSSFVW